MLFGYFCCVLNFCVLVDMDPGSSASATPQSLLAVALAQLSTLVSGNDEAEAALAYVQSVAL